MAALDADVAGNSMLGPAITGGEGADVGGDSMSGPAIATGDGGDVAADMNGPAIRDLSDLTPPVITFGTPAGNIGPNDPVAVQVTDNDGLFISISITAAYSPSGLVQTVYDGVGFTPLYDDNSTQTPIANGFDFVLRQDAPGWWEDVTITVTAIDILGNVTQGARAFAVPLGGGAPGTGPTDTVPPVVDNYDPLPGTTIEATDTISFDVTDDSGQFCSVMITAAFPDGSWEVIHTGDAFAPRYAAGSSRTVITDGFRYTCRRAGGWPGSPTIISFPVDAAGNPSV